MKKTNKYSTRELLTGIWKASYGARLQVAICAFVGIISVACSLFFVYLSKEAIDIATGVSTGVLWHYGLGMGILILAEILLRATNTWLANTLSVKTQNRLRTGLFERLIKSKWEGKEARHSGDVLNRLIQDINTIVSAIISTIPLLITTAVQFIASFCFLYSMDSNLAVMLVLILPFFALLSRIYVNRMRHMTKAVRESDSRIHSVMQESLQHKTVVKTLEQSESMINKLQGLQHNLYEEVKSRTRFSILSRTLVSTGFSMGYLTAFLWGVFRMQAGTITFGVMTAFLQLVGRIQRPLSDIARMIPALVGALTAAERLFELEETPIEDCDHPIRLSHTVGIRINDVSFTYSDGNETILQNFNAHFAPGSVTAILGKTGAGKTTLIRLILSLIHPDKGTITFYDQEQEVEASARTRNNLIYVPQGNTLFSGTIRENLLLGRPDATDEELHEVLRIACADFVEQFPDGIDSACSEQGGGLSEGQAQRIAIARSLLRPGSILLFDESTSALDADTERLFIQNITSLPRNKTIIFITHRTSVLEFCDQVLHV